MIPGGSQTSVCKGIHLRMEPGVHTPAVKGRVPAVIPFGCWFRYRVQPVCCVFCSDYLIRCADQEAPLMAPAATERTLPTYLTEVVYPWRWLDWIEPTSGMPPSEGIPLAVSPCLHRQQPISGLF
jgi:hypothetical protein